MSRGHPLTPKRTGCIELYESSAGVSPVDKFLRGLSKAGQARAISELEQLERYGIEGYGPPHTKRIEAGLWELRFPADRTQIRLIFTIIDQVYFALHGFKKKQDEIRQHDLETARERAGKCRARNR